MPDPLIDLLSTLPAATPDPVRAERTRACGRLRLARHRPQVKVAPSLRRHHRISVWQPLAALLAVVYLAAVVRFTLGVYGLA